MRRQSAFVFIPKLDEYPWRAIHDGLIAAGYGISETQDADILVVWSPWIGTGRAALKSQFDAAGKPVVVVENGWLSPIGAVPFYQVALNGWNGEGLYPAGGPERWHHWDLQPAPWREAGDGYALVIGQRGHPVDKRSAPPAWAEGLDGLLVAARGADRVRLRHRSALTPLRDDLHGAAEVHVWTSNAASWAILAGIPVVQHGPTLMVGDLASRPGAELRTGTIRTPFLERLAWAQWTEAEMRSGRPFARLFSAVAR